MSSLPGSVSCERSLPGLRRTQVATCVHGQLTTSTTPCTRLWITLGFIGLLLFLFGISLTITFYPRGEEENKMSKYKDHSTNAKFESSMRLTGYLLIASSGITLLIAVMFFLRLRHQQKDYRNSSGDVAPPITGISTSRIHNNNPLNTHENDTVEDGFSFFALTRRLRENWQRQGDWRPEVSDSCVNLPSQAVPDEPPEYYTLMELNKLKTVQPPPDYNVVV